MTYPQELEYVALRNELIKRIELQSRIVQINLTFIAAILAITTSGINFSQTLVMIYPPLAAAIASWFGMNEYHRQQLRTYIRNNLEPYLFGLGWEEWKYDNDIEVLIGGKKLRKKYSLSKIGIFSLIQAVIVGGIILSINYMTINSIEKLLFVIDLISFMVITIGFIFYYTAIMRLLALNDKGENEIKKK